MAVPICLKLERQARDSALDRTRCKDGLMIAARSAIMEITARSSIRVKDGERFNGFGQDL